MQKKLGISIYPEQTPLTKNLEYITLASKLGFKHLHTSLLVLGDTSSQKELGKFTETLQFARKQGMEVTADVNSRILQELQFSSFSDPQALAFFHDLGVTNLRWDDTLNGHEEAQFTYNKYGIGLEINASATNDYANLIRSFNVSASRLQATFNYYPQRNTGLDYNLFLQELAQHRGLGISTGAFITLAGKNQVTVWPEADGSPTLEMHRDLPLEFQARHLIALREIDLITIGTQYASAADLTTLSNLNLYKPLIKLIKVPGITAFEKAIVTGTNHYVRGDYSSKIIRSCEPRIEYASRSIEPRPVNQKYFEPGDVLILNDNFGRYKGELQIVQDKITNDGKYNLVGQIADLEQLIVNTLEPWVAFDLAFK